jgi:hypothetical protein
LLRIRITPNTVRSIMSHLIVLPIICDKLLLFADWGDKWVTLVIQVRV